MTFHRFSRTILQFFELMRAFILTTLTCLFVALPILLSVLSSADAASQKPVVAARVDNVPIYVAEVDIALADLIGNRELTPARRQRIRAEMLSQIVRQRIVLHYLRRNKLAVSPHQVNAEVKRLGVKLKARETTLKVHLASRGFTEQALREDLHWRLSWQKHLGRKITDESLEKYFEDHRPDFDGTRVRVSQVLLVPQDAADVASCRQRIVEIRDTIQQGDMLFADAAKKYSASPSKRVGGDIGFLTRHGEMHETITTAAFALKKGQMSTPLVTPHGVHLLRYTDIEPGKQTWQEARAELRRVMTRDIFRQIVASERPSVSVRYSGAMEYLDPKKNDRLVVPSESRSK